MTVQNILTKLSTLSDKIDRVKRVILPSQLELQKKQSLAVQESVRQPQYSTNDRKVLELAKKLAEIIERT